jgi:hypothetical protein
MRLVVRLALGIALTLLGLGSAGLARASLVALDGVAGAAYAPSATPGLLGPINETGRTGWDCAPERMAAASQAAHSALPDADGR